MLSDSTIIIIIINLDAIELEKYMKKENKFIKILKKIQNVVNN